MKNIFLAGSGGRLGKEICAAAHTKQLRIHPLKRDEPHQLPQLIKSCASRHEGSILLDVSLPEGTAAIVDNLLKTDCDGLHAFVIGVTGHSDKTLEKLTTLAQRLPIILSSNFSRGVYLFEEMLRAQTSSGVSVSQLAQSLGFDLALWESHHTQKKDAPSGTAKTLATAAGVPPEKITSTRVGSVVGEHALLFSQESEELRITHTAHARRLFAEGALDLCERILSGQLKRKTYSMAEALNELLAGRQ